MKSTFTEIKRTQSEIEKIVPESKIYKIVSVISVILNITALVIIFNLK